MAFQIPTDKTKAAPPKSNTRLPTILAPGHAKTSVREEAFNRLHRTGNHQTAATYPANKPVKLSVHVQATSAKNTAPNNQKRGSAIEIQGNKTAHHNPNRMCEMKRED
jgi:hypothetical protein